MTQLGLAGPTDRDERTGWRHQFKPSTTHAQHFFDVLFGIVAPVLCFTFDPIVFQSDVGGALFSELGSFVYMVSAIEISVLILFIGCGRRLSPRTRLIGGVLTAGAVFSGLIGIVILPFTLIGLFIFGIGFLGFIPFLTALVYMRNAKSAFGMAGDIAVEPETTAARTEVNTSHGWIAASVIGSVLVLGVPAALNLIAARLVSASMDAVLSTDPYKAEIATEELTYLRFVHAPNLDRMVSVYAAETDLLRKKQLKRRYFKISGKDIDERLTIMLD